MDIRRLVGDNIRRLRKQRGWSQADLAARLDVTSQQVHRIETGETGTPLTKIQELAELFGVSYAELFALPADDGNAEAIPIDDALRALPAEIAECLEHHDGALTIHVKPEWQEKGIPPGDFAQVVAAIYLALHRAGLDRPETDTTG